MFPTQLDQQLLGTLSAVDPHDLNAFHHDSMAIKLLWEDGLSRYLTVFDGQDHHTLRSTGASNPELVSGATALHSFRSYVNGIDLERLRTRTFDGPEAMLVVRECKRHEYRAKLKSTFGDIDKLRSAYDTDDFDTTLAEYTANKIASSQLSKLQKSIPVTISVAMTGGVLTYKLNTPCGFSVELARSPTRGGSRPESGGALAVRRAQGCQPVAGRIDFLASRVDLLRRGRAARSNRALRPRRLERKGTNLHAHARWTPWKTQVSHTTGRARIASNHAPRPAAGDGGGQFNIALVAGRASALSSATRAPPGQAPQSALHSAANRRRTL